MDLIAKKMGMALVSTIFAEIVLSFACASKLSGAAKRIAVLEAGANEHKKQLHRLEAIHLKAKNDLEVTHQSYTKRAREDHYNEGFQHGAESTQKDHLIEIINLRSTHREERMQREAEAEKLGRAMAKAEHEAQIKAFGVEIRPYVWIEKKTSFLSDSFKSHTGYQYQLLVNGIPAFSPHEFIESSETIKEANTEAIEKLVKIAEKSFDCSQSIS